MPVYINGVLQPSPGSVNSKVGWGYYQDGEYTTGNRLTAAGSTRIVLPNNAATKIETYLPAGVSSFYDGSALEILPQTVGDGYVFRVNMFAQSSTQDNFVTFELDIGGSEGVISSRVLTFPRGTAEQSYSLTTLVFSLSTFVTNGGQVYITPDDAVDFWNIEYLIQRVSSP